MQFRDVSHYVSRTDQHRRRGAGFVPPTRTKLPTGTEFALVLKNSLSNFDQFCAKLLTGKRHRGYEALVDSAVSCASMPTLWVVNNDKGRGRGNSFTAQFLAKNAGENCGQIRPQLLRCVSQLRPTHPLVMCHYLQTRPIAAGHRRWRAMTVLLSISDVQDRLCVSRSTVNRLIRDRKLECVHLGRIPRIPDDSVEKLIRELRATTPDFMDDEAES